MDDSGLRTLDSEDLGVEIASNTEKPEDAAYWFVWLRADYAGRYSRFVCVGHHRYQDALLALIHGLTGRKFDPADALYGQYWPALQAARLREEDRAMHMRLARQSGRAVERDLNYPHIDDPAADPLGKTRSDMR